MSTKTLAFYLPQFHPIPENDAWWGKGFTEWTNVTKAKPRFPGHLQPHLPADLGFYDLRLGEARAAQAELARAYNIAGFCYYHYWFDGKLLLDRPLRDVLASGAPDFPFCLCWANENWTRAWDGLDRQVLIQQSYSQPDAAAHIEHLLSYFSDIRYVRVAGRPLVLIYRPDIIPAVKQMLDLWRGRATEKLGVDLYVAGVRTGLSKWSDEQYLEAGFDAVVDFQPNRENFPRPTGVRAKLKKYLQDKLPDKVYQYIKLNVSANNIVPYAGLVAEAMKRPWPKNYTKMPCVFPSWDNSARRKTATIIQNDDPDLFGEWISHAMRQVAEYPESERIVFINAWNEWAEGCHLEPDQRLGLRFLEAVKARASR